MRSETMTMNQFMRTMNKKLAMLIMTVSVLAGCTAAPTFAQVDAGTEEYWDVTTSTGTKEFLTLTSRAGNFYYLIIDRDKDGNQNVHFLNQVDERDLISIMDEDEAKELEESITQKAEAKKAEEEAKAAEEAAKAAAEAEAQNPPEPTSVPEKTVTIGGYEYSQKIVGGIIAGVAAIIIILIVFFALGKKQKAEQDKPDPDADYDDEYGDEIDIPEGEPEDDDYEE